MSDRKGERSLYKKLGTVNRILEKKKIIREKIRRGLFNSNDWVASSCKFALAEILFTLVLYKVLSSLTLLLLFK